MLSLLIILVYALSRSLPAAQSAAQAPKLPIFTEERIDLPGVRADALPQQI
jgi:hypothetical protein